MAETYIEESIEKKKKVCKLLMGEKKMETPPMDVLPSTSSARASTNPQMNLPANEIKGLSFAGNSFQNAQNCSFHFHFSE